MLSYSRKKSSPGRPGPDSIVKNGGGVPIYRISTVLSTKATKLTVLAWAHRNWTILPNLLVRGNFSSSIQLQVPYLKVSIFVLRTVLIGGAPGYLPREWKVLYSTVLYGVYNGLRSWRKFRKNPCDMVQCADFLTRSHDETMKPVQYLPTGFEVLFGVPVIGVGSDHISN